eukprot:scaffold84848_cov71-Phaeocystis_antarctica.AAC.3
MPQPARVHAAGEGEAKRLDVRRDTAARGVERLLLYPVLDALDPIDNQVGSGTAWVKPLDARLRFEDGLHEAELGAARIDGEELGLSLAALAGRRPPARAQRRRVHSQLHLGLVPLCGDKGQGAAVGEVKWRRRREQRVDQPRERVVLQDLLVGRVVEVAQPGGARAHKCLEGATALGKRVLIHALLLASVRVGVEKLSHRNGEAGLAGAVVAARDAELLVRRRDAIAPAVRQDHLDILRQRGHVPVGVDHERGGLAACLPQRCHVRAALARAKDHIRLEGRDLLPELRQVVLHPEASILRAWDDAAARRGRAKGVKE